MGTGVDINRLNEFWHFFEKKTWLIIFLTGLFWLISCQVIFVLIQFNQSETLQRSIQVQFREELKTSNFLYLSRIVSDLTQNNAIQCALFSQREEPIPRTILDLRFSNFCKRFFFDTYFLGGDRVTQELTALNGERYILEYTTVNSGIFFAALWILRLSGLLIIALGYMLLRVQKVKAQILLSTEKKVSEARVDLAKQVAHDIRSPLSALNMAIGLLKSIPEENAALIKSATIRINEIANDLLQEPQKNLIYREDGRGQDKAENGNSHVCFLPGLLHTIISEKKLQFFKEADLQLEADYEHYCDAFAIVNEVEMKRVLSNLINNAIESFEGAVGKVSIRVLCVEIDGNKRIEVSVQDNGRGIPKEILNSVGKKGFSHKKSGAGKGSGLGVFHAKNVVESFGGSIHINSVVGSGTTVRIILPAELPQKWLANKIDLTNKERIITLDSNLEIHQTWSSIVFRSGITGIEHLSFFSSDELRRHVLTNINKMKTNVFLISHEQNDKSISGLDLVDELGIEKQSILIANNYEDVDIRRRAEELKLLVLPKFLVGFVKVEKNM